MADSWPNPRCSDCGHFTRWTADSLVSWGSSGDLEPPDPEYLCDGCAEKMYEAFVASFIKRGIQCNDHRPYWHSPESWYRARRTVRAMRKHGLVTLPIRHERVREEYGYMKNATGDGTRSWCACGWNTGWNRPAFGEGSSHEKMRAHLTEQRDKVAA